MSQRATIGPRDVSIGGALVARAFVVYDRIDGVKGHSDDLRREVIENMRILADLTGSAVRSFAYPFGGSVTSELTAIVQEAGIETAFTVDDLAITVGCDPLRISRLEVRDCSEDEFEARLRFLLEA